MSLADVTLDIIGWVERPNYKATSSKRLISFRFSGCQRIVAYRTCPISSFAIEFMLFRHSKQV